MSDLTDADFGYPAWRGFIEWAHRQPDMQAQFCADTKRPWPASPKNVWDAMIDDATGFTSDHTHAFVLWASELYGIDHAPPGVRDEINASKAAAI